MFVNTQMLSRAQLAKMQAMFIYLAVDNFKEKPTANKFIKLLDETREYLGCIDAASSGDLTSFVKEGFDAIQGAAVICSDRNWNDFPIMGIEAMAAMACSDFLPDIRLRMILQQKKDEFNLEIASVKISGDRHDN